MKPPRPKASSPPSLCPTNWCGYGAVIEGFKAKYPGITVNELNPDAGSADEIEAIKRQPSAIWAHRPQT